MEAAKRKYRQQIGYDHRAGFTQEFKKQFGYYPILVPKT
jgi:hypothetical protein